MGSLPRTLVAILFFLIISNMASAQVFSPKILTRGQIDTWDLAAMAKGIYAKAGAATPREKAVAIWRFFLTDGRFVPPGIWYHIAGWAYEEPQGEVLDPLKLLNSYGFGLCYQIAPLLQAVYRAGGFEDARVWFLTGHTVTEVFYEGAYHHFDSDMMGYTSVGIGNPKTLPVASVLQIAADGNIILGKLISPTTVDSLKVDYPWYPADLRAGAIGDLAALFTTSGDNWLFSHIRYPESQSMDFVLRPGERLIRYFKPETEKLFYLPFKYDGKRWQEFPREVAEFKIRTEDGPRSQKDERRWATGSIEYKPVLSDRASYYLISSPGLNTNLKLPTPQNGFNYLGREQRGLPARATFELQSPYVLIDARVSLEVILQQKGQRLETEISTDGGRSWELMSALDGPYHGSWKVEPVVKLQSQHGNLTAASGKYKYLVRFGLSGLGPEEDMQLKNIQISSCFQVNPRTLPALVAGRNAISYQPGPAVYRNTIPVQLEQLSKYALRATEVEYVTENGQGVLWPLEGKAAEIIFELSAPGVNTISGFDAGARFLDLRDGLAPDKVTAETRKTRLGGKSEVGHTTPRATMAWSTSSSGEFTPLWKYDPEHRWSDGRAVDQVLRWPEIDRGVRAVPAGTRKVYVRYQLSGMGLDSLRLALFYYDSGTSGELEITHQWSSAGQRHEHVEHIRKPWMKYDYQVDTGSGDPVENYAIIFYCPPR